MIDELAIGAEERRGRDAAVVGRTKLLVIGRIGDRRFAIPAASIAYCLRMTAVTPLPAAPRSVVGAVNLRGTVVPVVDPRPWFDVPTPRFHPEQYLVLVRAQCDFLLWVDRLDQTFVAHD